MSRLCHILHYASVTFLCCISLFTNNGAYAAGLNGVFDAGWTTAYQSYKNNQLFPKSIEAAKIAGTKIWLGLYYNGEDWFLPPTVTQLDTLCARNVRVLNELYELYGRENVIDGVYIPQEIALYYWDGLREDATAESLVTHFLKPIELWMLRRRLVGRL